jgi:hypothetical protein
MAPTLCSIIDYEPINLPWVYEGTCFGPMFFFKCQYAMNDDKVSMDFRQVNVKNAQVGLQNTISWKKKIGRHDVRMEESMC